MLHFKTAMSENEFCFSCFFNESTSRNDSVITVIQNDEEHLNCRFYGFTHLHLAVYRKFHHVFKFLIEHPSVDLNAIDRECKTPLHIATEEVEEDMALKLIQLGCDVNKKDKYGFTPLMNVIKHGCGVELVREILKRGANVNEQNKFGYTALHYACGSFYLSVMDLLIFYGADPRIRNNKYETSFMTLLRHPMPDNDVVSWQEILIEFEADMNEINARGVSTLFLAIKFETPLLAEIIERGANVNYYHKNLNALHLALRTQDAFAFNLIWPQFDYRRVYGFRECTPLLCDLFHDLKRSDWFQCFTTVCNNDDVLQHAVQHYISQNNLPSLVSELITSFGKRDVSQLLLLHYVKRVVLYGATVTLKDIETVYIHCINNHIIESTVEFLLTTEVTLVRSTNYYISLPYIILKVTRDVRSVFNNYEFPDDFRSVAEQLMFLPRLFKFCTPTKRFMRKLYEVYYEIEMEYENEDGSDSDKDFRQLIIQSYDKLIETLEDTMTFIPSLIEVSRNASRKAICSYYRINKYSQYKHVIRNSTLPESVFNILLFRQQVNDINLFVPPINVINRFQLVRDVLHYENFG